MIYVAACKVRPREVEDVLHQHPAVREVAVVGVPDSYRDETMKILRRELRGGPTPSGGR
jgi:long-chain acyl-CoA synthetase